MVHFHLKLPLAHNHPPLRPSAKISEAPEYPFTRDGEGELVVWYNPSARVYHEQPWHLAAWSFEIGREEVGDLVGGRRGGKREGETGSVKIRRSRETRSMKERRREEEWRVEREDEQTRKEDIESEGEKGRATRVLDLGQRSEIIFPLRLHFSSSISREAARAKRVRQDASPPPPPPPPPLPLPLSNYSLTPSAIYLRSSAIITCYYLILTLLAIWV